LRVHTTNDNTGLVKDQYETRQSSEAQYLGVDDYNLSQIVEIRIGRTRYASL
jgi:hypothetical protein